MGLAQYATQYIIAASILWSRGIVTCIEIVAITNLIAESRCLMPLSYVKEKVCMYSGTPLYRTPLGPSTSDWISEVSSLQGLLKYGGCGLLL